LEEARALAGLDPSLPAAKILGLRELCAVNDGTLSLEDAKAAAKQATRNYAKRQLTWFRNRMANWILIQEEGDSLGAQAWLDLARQARE
jgi:tRNA dimethylallyltransferase